MAHFSNSQFLMEPEDSKTITVKVILAGNHEAGKTMFLMKWKDPDSQIIPQPTIATQLVCQTVDIDGIQIKMQLWDTAGQEAYRSITVPYFRSCKGVFLVFDLTNRQSFEDLDYWLELIHENTHSNPYIVLIANKNDLPDQVVTIEEIDKFCKEKELAYFMVSAKTGENVVNAGKHMANRLTTKRSQIVETIQLDSNKPPENNDDCC